MRRHHGINLTANGNDVIVGVPSRAGGIDSDSGSGGAGHGETRGRDPALPEPDSFYGGGGMDSNGLWLRLYTDFYRNGKVRTLPEALQIRFVWLLCLHKEGRLVGRSMEQIAWDLRLTFSDITDTLAALITARLLMPDLTPVGWEDRQYQSDSSTSRVRKHRETLRERFGNVTETVQSRVDTESDTDTESETDADKNCVVRIILKDGSYHNVTVADATRLKELYPYVDIEQQLRNIAGWNEANPAKRKTKAGITRHVNSWIARRQEQVASPMPHLEPEPPDAGPMPAGLLERLNEMAGR